MHEQTHIPTCSDGGRLSGTQPGRIIHVTPELATLPQHKISHPNPLLFSSSAQTRLTKIHTFEIYIDYQNNHSATALTLQAVVR